MTAGVHAESTRKLERSWCLHCENLPEDSTRERVRQHVAKHGHTARYGIEHITVYRPDGGAR